MSSMCRIYSVVLVATTKTFLVVVVVASVAVVATKYDVLEVEVVFEDPHEGRTESVEVRTDHDNDLCPEHILQYSSAFPDLNTATAMSRTDRQ